MSTRVDSVQAYEITNLIIRTFFLARTCLLMFNIFCFVKSHMQLSNIGKSHDFFTLNFEEICLCLKGSSICLVLL